MYVIIFTPNQKKSLDVFFNFVWYLTLFWNDKAKRGISDIYSVSILIRNYKRRYRKFVIRATI